MKTEAGFTLTELVAVMFIASLTVGIGFSAYYSSGKLFAEWDRRARTIRLADAAVQRIVVDVRMSKSIVFLSDSLALLDIIDGKEIVYRFPEGNVTRNGVAFNSDSSIIISAGILPTHHGYAVVVTAISRSQTASARADVQQLESSVLAFRASLSDAGAN